MVQYKSLENTSYEQLAECFRLAFSDYYFPMQLSPQQLQAHLEQSGVDLGLSYGAFADETIVGFIFNASSLYNGQKAAFDVGTAVVPQHRGKGIFHQMFQIMERKLVLQSMVSTYSNISVKNIDTAYPQVLELLHSLQFKEVTRQFEMSKKLS